MRLSSSFSLPCAALAVSVMLAVATSLVAATGRRPNVLFIAADDLRTDLGAYGHQQVHSPHIDALARRGMVFERAYCQQAVCNPSRASIMTGLRPDELRVWDLAARFRVTRPDAVTLPQYFKENGYTTFGIGKIFHNEPARSAETHRAPMADPVSWSAPPTHATGAHWQDWVVPGDPDGPKRKAEAVQCLDVPDNAYFDGQIADEACATIRRLRGESQPFFLAVGFWKPHLPFNAPKIYWDLYNRATLMPPSSGFPKGAPKIARHKWKELRGYEGVPKEGPLSAAQVAELRHGYLACISFLDAQAGRVLAELERQGLEEETVVVFWGDHGFHLGEHALWGKTSNYELDARVPLIVAGHGNRAIVGRTEALVELVDVYPTLVELAGLPARGGLAGKSFAPVLRDPLLPGKPFAVTQHPHPFYGAKPTHMGYAVRTPQYRYIEWRAIAGGRVTARELYDHAADPAETTNQADNPALRAVTEELGHYMAGIIAAGGRWASATTR